MARDRDMAGKIAFTRRAVIAGGVAALVSGSHAILVMIAAHKGDAKTLFGADGLAAMLTSVDDLGYGIGVALKGDGAKVIAMKRGNNLGFRSGLVACPASGQGAVVMTNGNGGEPVVDAVLDALTERYRWPVRAPWPE